MIEYPFLSVVVVCVLVCIVLRIGYHVGTVQTETRAYSEGFRHGLEVGMIVRNHPLKINGFRQEAE